MLNSKIIGSTLIIAGTTVGAGMLALPLASAAMGFTTATLTLLCLWGLMLFSACLMIELHQHADINATLHQLAGRFLGRYGQGLVSVTMLMLFYALCAAYISGGSEQLHSKWAEWQGTSTDSKTAMTLLFTAIVALVILLGTAVVDKLNRVLFGLKLVLLALVLSALLPNVHSDYLLSMPVEQGLVITAIPILFTSFGFHGSIPAVVKYLEGNTAALRKVMLFGSAIPFVVYVLWQGVSLGAVSQASLIEQGQLSAFVNTLAQQVDTPRLQQFVSSFADLALLTSFLGVSLGLFEFIQDSLRRRRSTALKLPALLLTFGPPCAFALYYPQGFISALGYAAIALALLAVIFPVVMVYRVRYGDIFPTGQQAAYQVRGGKVSLWLAGMSALTVIVIQLLISRGILIG